MNAMNRFANSAETPGFDAPQIVRRTRRRRTLGIAAVAAALIAAGGGTALATSASGGTSQSAASSTAAASNATTLQYRTPDGVIIPIDFAGLDLVFAKQELLKTQTKLGTVTKKAVKNCKPGSVVGVSPHAPAIVKSGDTVNLTLCAG
ncbi:PASTA domain-containing protein [Streptomyces sp. NPDC020298]|uniref:PASTA domain-containing protein n=1 Tax=unclassified Streptomyces TaxID=2593676 RepID=UPI0033D9B16C